jgi:hypothetical protein
LASRATVPNRRLAREGETVTTLSAEEGALLEQNAIQLREDLLRDIR